MYVKFFRLLFALFVIILIVPQTPKENIVLRALHSKHILANYGEEKRFLTALTWFTIFSFLILAFLSSMKKIL